MVLPAVATAVAYRGAGVGAARQFLAAAGDDEERVVDTDPETDHRREVGDEDVEVAEAGAAPRTPKVTITPDYLLHHWTARRETASFPAMNTHARIADAQARVKIGHSACPA